MIVQLYKLVKSQKFDLIFMNLFEFGLGYTRIENYEIHICPTCWCQIVPIL